MAVYQFEGMDASGATKVGSVEAESIDEAQTVVSGMGYFAQKIVVISGSPERVEPDYMNPFSSAQHIVEQQILNEKAKRESLFKAGVQCVETALRKLAGTNRDSVVLSFKKPVMNIIITYIPKECWSDKIKSLLEDKGFEVTVSQDIVRITIPKEVTPNVDSEAADNSDSLTTKRA